jgi:hypothetical protein
MTRKNQHLIYPFIVLGFVLALTFTLVKNINMFTSNINRHW